jgi:hypothetical protein
MKSKEEIEQLAFLKYPRVINDPYNPMEDDNTYERKIWIDAYTQCQEDVDWELIVKLSKRYTEEDMWHLWLRCKPTVIVNEQQESHEKELFENFIQSLNKQD